MQAFDTPSTAVPPPPRPALDASRDRSQTLQLVLFLVAVVWYLCARALSASAANGLALRFDLSDTQPLLQALMLLFLVVVGLAMLHWMERRPGILRNALGLPARATSREEWTTGASFGWALAVASILPMALNRSLNVQLWTAPRAFYLLALSLLTLAILTLAHALAIYGFGLQRLIEATAPVRATLIVVAVVTAAHATVTPPYGTPEGTRILVDMLTTLLFCLCWQRSRGLWLLWGFHFAWAASTGALFGLPLAGNVTFASVVDTRVSGPIWLTGGVYGPGAAALTILVLVAAIPVLVRITSDYAWEYTRPPIIAAGYDVTLAPPLAHAAMEQAAAQTAGPASLVQIQTLTPQQQGSAAERIPE